MYFQVDDATYSYEVMGQGPAVVLLHGFTGSKQTWTTFMSKWKDDFQMIIIDLPGHGETVTLSPRSMEACCNDIKKLFDYLGLTKVHLVGYSMGGRTSLSFAMLYPEAVSSLILESSSPGLKEEEQREMRRRNDEKLARKIEQEGISSFVHFWESIALFQTQKKLPTSVQQQIRDERLSQKEKGLADSLRYMGTGSQPSWWESLRQLLCPVLLIVGELDIKFVKINEAMKIRLPLATLEVVKHAGHAIHVEQPEIFGAAVASFITKQERLND